MLREPFLLGEFGDILKESMLWKSSQGILDSAEIVSVTGLVELT
jgi:hypothetical protein